MSKTAIVILTDPASGSDEALGRAVNALGVAYDFKQHNEDVKIIFQGTGTRWPELLQKPDHYAHALYSAVEDKIEGISCGCAEVFGANASGLDLIKDNTVPGTGGFPSWVKMQKEGYNIVTF